VSVYKAIAAVMADLSIEGISKSKRNTQGAGYNFRGIDDVMNTLSGLLAKHGLVIIPRVMTRENVERASKSGGALFFTAVEVEFDLVSVEDGSKHTARTAGEAMDSSDKSTNKAMSAAYKYMAIQTFCIPTEGDNDADAHTYEVKASKHKNYAILMGELNKGLMSDDIARMWKDAEFIKLRKEMPEEQQQQLHTEMTAIGKALKAKETAKKDTVGAIKEEFPGSEVRDERITNVDGREVHPMEGF